MERRYTVTQITQHPWMLQSAVVAPPPPSQTPGGTRLTIVAAGAPPTPAPATVGNDTLSQNNNSNDMESVLTRLLAHLLRNNPGVVSPTNQLSPLQRHRLVKAAARYAWQTAVDCARLRADASRI